MAFQLLQNMTSGHVKVKKGTGHVFYMATPSHATESVYSVWPLYTRCVLSPTPLIKGKDYGHLRNDTAHHNTPSLPNS